MRVFPHIGIQIPEVFLPAKYIDLARWSVIACDQYTSQPQYWQHVEALVGQSPSTYHLILPEVYLPSPDVSERIQTINHSMKKYLLDGTLIPYEGLILVERQTNQKTRHGLIVALDLESYDYHPGSKSLIRASEQTIVERIPPRLKIRENALLESPHILVLLDDPEKTVIEPLINMKPQLELLYDFNLMQNGGRLKGFGLNSQQLINQVVFSLENLLTPASFKSRYGLSDLDKNFLFAVGDGNHSLATAKAYWEKIKGSVKSDHPARYALVELENIHDEGLEFRPIHRLLFDVNEDFLEAMRRYFGGDFSYAHSDNLETIRKTVDAVSPKNTHHFGVIDQNGSGLVTISNPKNNLSVGTLQNFLDHWKMENGYRDIDFVHGTETVNDIGKRPGNLGFYLPSMNKQDFFKTIIMDGVLPRKTFSMGESDEKRFYMECRKIA